jgi:hypothetical protein
MELEKKWKDLGIKDKVQYVMAILLIVSGIILAFLSFALTFTIATGTLIYISQCFITAGGIFGVSIYFKTKIGQFSSDATNKLEQMIEKVITKHENENHSKP